jgi:transcriptional regulator with XRE-family HTH domain
MPLDTRDDTEALREIGSAVRARRRQLGYTLRTIASGTGLSVPFLSQIENAAASPSLTSLFAIARFLETTPERLLAGPVSADVVLTHRSEGQLYAVTDAEDSALRRQLTGLGEPFSAAEYVVEPGTDLGDFYASDGREMIHVLTGQLAVDLIEESSEEAVVHQLEAGDTLIYTTSVRHRWRHHGDGPTRFLHVSAPLG